MGSRRATPEFKVFFKAATTHDPYAWQCRLACGPDADPDMTTVLKRGAPCESKLINIPTGLGKTAGVTLAWLWNRIILPQSPTGDRPADVTHWPRRLVYCLPMRTLVEQTAAEVEKWLKNLLQACPDNPDLRWLCGIDPAEKNLLSEIGNPPSDEMRSPVILMGGEDLHPAKRDWDIYPEKPCILIGTQDMLLSRALNRGYGMSRCRWPVHFGLLNNDALWVCDEVQLMGSGLWTTAQLDWMRYYRFPTFRPTISWWMSATLGESFFGTQDRDSDSMPSPKRIDLLSEEQANLAILKARRPIEVVNPKPSKGAKKTARTAKKDKTDKAEAFFQAMAHSVWEKHIPGTLSMIVCNRVSHAQRLHACIDKSISTRSPRTVLLTSRFRPRDRRQAIDEVLAFEEARKRGSAHSGLILVSTQVVEAGFDVSAARLWTEAAPWPSMLQRLGRLNRDAKLNDQARAFVFDVPAERGDTVPYDPTDIKESQAIIGALVKLCVDSPTAPIGQLLNQLQHCEKFGERIVASLQPKPQPFPRALDVHGLFSTEPDVFGGFTDVSPWVRNSDANADATVFWRDFAPKKADANQGDGPGFQRDEGCPVAVFRLREFLGKERQAWHWEPKRQDWQTIATADIRPGMTLMLPASFGGYDPRRGWTGVRRDALADVPPPGPFDERDSEDRQLQSAAWVTLETHLGDTVNLAKSLASELALSPADDACLRRAAELHDIGKSLAQWQGAIPSLSPEPNTLWAKFGGSGSFRPGFRHEVASALAMWHRYYRQGEADFPALAIYLVAAHHGKVRTVLSSLPHIGSSNVCGIPADGPAELPWNPPWRMDFEAARDGAAGLFQDDGSFIFHAPGWTGLVADLLGGWEANAPARTCGAVPDTEPAALGPFTLAFYETLLRACDGRASSNPSAFVKPPLPP